MRVIERQMLKAILNGKGFVNGNTAVTHLDDGTYRVRLHDNLIATGRKGELPEVFNFCGWNTTTTRSRLRALGCDLVRERDGYYINGKRVRDFCHPISRDGTPRHSMEIKTR